MWCREKGGDGYVSWGRWERWRVREMGIWKMVNEVFAPFGMAALLSSQRDSSQLLKSPTERGPNGLDDATCTVSGRPIKSGLKPGRSSEILAPSVFLFSANSFNKPDWKGPIMLFQGSHYTRGCKSGLKCPIEYSSRSDPLLLMWLSPSYNTETWECTRGIFECLSYTNTCMKALMILQIPQLQLASGLPTP